MVSGGGGDEQMGWPARLAIVHNHTMVSLFLSFSGALRSAFRTHADLVVEDLALRPQLANFQRTSARSRLRKNDRAFERVLSRLWSRWADALVVVKPDTVVRWHRAGFRLFWRWKSRRRTPAQNEASPEIKALIRQMAKANPSLGGPRIHGELLKLGIDIDERSVSRFIFPGMLKQRSFHIVVVGEGREAGMDLTPKPDQVVSYYGSRDVVKF